MVNKSLQDELFLLVGYLLTSAYGLYSEPQGYGPFRLMDASGRLLQVMNAHSLGDSFTQDMQKMIDAERFGNSNDEALRMSLDQMILKYTEELKKRTEESV